MNFKQSFLNFSIRKLSIGVASIAISSIFFKTQIASADTISQSQKINQGINNTSTQINSKQIDLSDKKSTARSEENLNSTQPKINQPIQKFLLKLKEVRTNHRLLSKNNLLKQK